MIVDGVFGSEHIDSSGEVLSVDGADITELEEGRGLFCYEHKGHEGKSNGEEIVGKILSAKKIRKASDCANDRERMFWDSVKMPFIYGVGRLYDGAGHTGAQSIAAQIRDHAANDEPIVVSFSVEGTTLKRKDNILQETMIRRVAITTRPCNKATSLGILEDPNAPEGFPKAASEPLDVAAAVKNEFTDPRYQRLGGSAFIYGPDMLKAMAAGNYNAAPGSLTGGAALQVEDRTLKARALAAHRDWDKSGKFRDFLKTRLPEVSDEFLDHYSTLVEAGTLRLRKAQEVVANLRKAGKEVKKPGSVKKQPQSPFVVQGLPVPASAQHFSSFDPAAGILTTPQGQFKTSTPDDPHPNLVQSLGANAKKIGPEFQKEMEVQRPHHLKAMKNWLQMNDRYLRGDISPQVLAHAVAFSMMSPGVPVPMQEYMYGHLVDTLKEHGVQAPTAANWGKIRDDWMDKNRSGLPQHSREHFRRLEQQLIASKTGEYRGFNKPNKFAEYFGEYLRDHHNDVLNLVRESKGDSHQLARRLTEVRGIQPKLARYMLGMLGAGDIVVPDTHFIRHYFGLRPDAEGKPGQTPDEATKEHIRKALTLSADSNNILDGIDQAYARHPAMASVLNDPALASYFKGRENQAIFPAFWRHWISIPGHETRMGTPNVQNFNRDTSHAPFWDAVAPMMKKSEDTFDPDLPIRTAAQHQRWVEQYGAMRALDLFHHYLAPKLMANDQANVRELVQKFEIVGIQLRQALSSVALKKNDEPQAQPAYEPPETVEFQGQHVKPGLLFNRKQQAFTLFHAGKEFIGVPDEKFRTGKWGPEDLVRLPRNVSGVSNWMPDYDVEAYPEISAHAKIDMHRDGIGEFNHHSDSFNLAHGFDMNTEEREGGYTGINSHKSFWSKSPTGARVYVKGDGVHPGSARLEATYANAARDFFGLGHMVPKVAAFRHPQTGEEYAMIESLPGREGWENRYDNPVLDKEETDKAAIMNFVMMNRDRHGRNWLSDGNKLKLIDHGLTFASETGTAPSYLEQSPDRGAKVLSDDTKKWLASLDENELGNYLRRHELDEVKVEETKRRLKALKDFVANPLHTYSTKMASMWYNIPWR